MAEQRNFIKYGESCSMSDLCETCRGLHLTDFAGARENRVVKEYDFSRGPDEKIHCPVCRLIRSILPLPPAKPTSEGDAEYDLEGGWARPASLYSRTKDYLIRDSDNKFQGELGFETNSEEFYWKPYDKSWIEKATPNKIDFAPIKDWLETCEKDHDCCSAQGDSDTRNPQEIYVIDVIDGCITQKTTRDRYVALSWMKEDANEVKFTIADFENLKTPGSLQDHLAKLGVLFSDAVQFSRAIGVRYVWIPEVCNIHDNNQQPYLSESAKCSIIARACLTIVALSAESANSFLPGVRERSRSISAGVVNITDATPDSPVRFFAFRQLLNLHEEYSPYCKRWSNHLEVLCSSRIVIPMGSQVFYHCGTGDVQSDGPYYMREGGLSGFFREIESSHMLLLTSRGLRKITTLDESYKLSLYLELISTCTDKREPNDAISLESLEVALRQFSKHFQWKFVAGLPIQYIHLALLWGAASTSVRDESRPSWSWIAWSETIRNDLGILGVGIERSLLPTVQPLAEIDFGGPVNSDIDIVDFYNLHPTAYGKLHIKTHTLPLSAIKLEVYTDRGYPATAAVDSDQKFGVITRVPENLDQERFQDGKFELVAICQYNDAKVGDFFIPFIMRDTLGAFGFETAPSKSDTVNLVHVLLVFMREDKAERIGTGLLMKNNWDKLKGEEKKFVLT